MRPGPAEVLAQLHRAGLGEFIVPGSIELNTHSIKGFFANPSALWVLRVREEFKEGVFYILHDDVGPIEDCTEFRGHKGAFGRGSVQVVYNKKTGYFYADIDKYSAYEDVVGMFGHLFVEVVPNTVKGWWRRVRT